jgi:sugar phosphate isomerase/epimerase
MNLVMFSKKLGGFDIPEAGRIISELGFDGVDLTVRPGGHISPEDAAVKLPAAVETLRSWELNIPMISTGISSEDDPFAEEIFGTASNCGIGFLKLGYWHYEGFGKVYEQLREVRIKAKGLARLASEHGIVAGIHIHSGPYMTATGDLVARILEGMETDNIGAYIDPGHMVLEGGRSGWKLGMDLLRDSTKMVAVKDFGWERATDKDKTWKLVHMPLSEGMVPWMEVFDYLGETGFDGPVSLHSEYEQLETEEIIEQTSRDLSYIRSIIAR